MLRENVMADGRTQFDKNVVCPVTGEELFCEGEALVPADGGPRYDMVDGVPALFIDADERRDHSETTNRVKKFYTDAPFPNYNDLDNTGVLVESATRSYFATSLSRNIPMNARVLEVGCGTGRLGNFLAATTMTHVCAVDMSLASLRLGEEFARRNRINGIKFAQMNLFHPCIRKQSMDVVICTGVLHHTPDPKRAFMAIAPLVKPGGHILVGLYSKVGRLRTDFRRSLYKLFGEAGLALDPHLRRGLSPDKRRNWILDQYCHPQEAKHTMSQTLDWFSEAGFSFVSSIPGIMEENSNGENLFQQASAGTALGRFYTELAMLFTQPGGEGGLFVMVGRKEATSS